MAGCISSSAMSRARGQRAEVFCPSISTAAQITDKTVLVYELHVTNFDLAPPTPI
jgi:hypothetical protein